MNNKDCWILLENEGFVRWVLHPDVASDRYWEGWIRQDTRRAALVEQAKELLHQLQQSPPPSERQALSRQIWKGIQEGLQTKEAAPFRCAKLRPRGWAVAAAPWLSWCRRAPSSGTTDAVPVAVKFPAEAVAGKPIPFRATRPYKNARTNRGYPKKYTW